MKRLVSFALAAALLVPAAAQAKGAAKAADKAGGCKLKLDIGPPDTEIWIDGQKKGTAEKLKEVSLSPGNHELVLKHKGDERSDQVTLKKGATTSFQWKFEDDRPKPPPSDDDAQQAAAPGGDAPAQAPSDSPPSGEGEGMK
ncbi:MAG: PEGA domain-containing protein [Deltaproteobacteria bacterium]|nr:PEGA domain-containing protein [Deltaproteobacteria bacterium]